MKAGGRKSDTKREIHIELDFTRHAEGSVLISVGDTRVLCTCSIEDKVPSYLNNMHQGWVTAEYGMLPSPTSTRTPRESAGRKQSGRPLEIQRLTGRWLRSLTTLSRLDPRPT